MGASAALFIDLSWQIKHVYTGLGSSPKGEWAGQPSCFNNAAETTKPISVSWLVQLKRTMPQRAEPSRNR